MELTMEDEAVFDAAFSIENKIHDSVQFMYYYHSDSTVRKVLAEDSIRLRLNHVDQFPDKLEGRAIEVYYDIALDELEREGRISKEQASILAKANMPEKNLIIKRGENEASFGAEKKCDAYIICFSTKKDDPNMYENYGRNGKGTFCLGFWSFVFENLRHEEYENNLGIEWIQVVYGRDAVELLKNKILKYLNNAALSDKSRRVLVEEVLHEFRFSAKRPRYSFENERRLVVYVPEKEEICSHLFEKYEEKEKKYLRLNIDKCYLESIAADPKNNRDVTEELYNCLRIRGYGDAIETKDCLSK